MSHAALCVLSPSHSQGKRPWQAPLDRHTSVAGCRVWQRVEGDAAMSQWSEKPQRYSATSLLSLLRRISFLAIKPVLAHRAQTQPLGCDAGRHVHARAATQRSGRSHRALAPCGTCCGQGLPAASAACFAARATERNPSFHCLRCARGRATLRGAEHGAGCLRFLKNKCFFKGGDGRPPAFGAETGPKSRGAAGRDARGGWIKRLRWIKRLKEVYITKLCGSWRIRRGLGVSL